jgi:glycosyltransferase involved in cell wall biosynthesis
MLAEAYRKLCEKRRDAALIVAGDGPYRATMEKKLSHLPAHFLGTLGDEELAQLYASADLFLFPSRTDTLGQVVMEAQASGLPCLVSPDGGPKESIEDGRTGVVVSDSDPARWAGVVGELLDDADRRTRMGELAAQRGAKATLSRTFGGFWDAHLAACEQASVEPALAIPRLNQQVML